jgi:hypothetical protein
MQAMQQIAVGPLLRTARNAEYQYQVEAPQLLQFLTDFRQPRDRSAFALPAAGRLGEGVAVGPSGSWRPAAAVE